MNEIGRIKRFNTIGGREIGAVEEAMHSGSLSGYLAGQLRGGELVRMLEDKWAERFGVKHAIACNSATSGLMAAAFAVGLKRGDQFLCPAMTMSATVAAPMFTGATPHFCDVTDDDFGLDVPVPIDNRRHKAIFITNLFGHPARLTMWRYIALDNGIPLVEDNSQSPFAMENGRYAGTFGDIGVWSLNCHKHLQTGEGGICTTDDGRLALRMRRFINHGELSDGQE